MTREGAVSSARSLVIESPPEISSSAAGGREILSSVLQKPLHVLKNIKEEHYKDMHNHHT